jgi:fatty acyl-CoA reductase
MMEGSMLDAARIIGYLKEKSILITGSTGFLGKSKISISIVTNKNY